MPNQQTLGFAQRAEPAPGDARTCRGHWFYANGASVWRCSTREYAIVRSPKTGDTCDVCRRPIVVHSADPGHGCYDLTGAKVYLARWGEWERLKWAER